MMKLEQPKGSDGRTGQNTASDSLTISSVLSLGITGSLEKQHLLKIAEILVQSDPFACAAELRSGRIDMPSLKKLGIEFNDLVQLFFPDHLRSGNQKIVFLDRDNEQKLSSKEQFLRLRTLISDTPVVRIYGTDQIAFEYQAEIIPGTQCRLFVCRNYSFESTERGSALLGSVILGLKPASEDYFLRTIFEEGCHIKLGENATEFEVKIERERLMGERNRSTLSPEQILQEVLVNYIHDTEQQRRSVVFALSSIESMDFQQVFRDSLQAHATDQYCCRKLEKVIDDALIEGNRFRTTLGWSSIARF